MFFNSAKRQFILKYWIAFFSKDISRHISMHTYMVCVVSVVCIVYIYVDYIKIVPIFRQYRVCMCGIYMNMCKKPREKPIKEHIIIRIKVKYSKHFLFSMFTILFT